MGCFDAVLVKCPLCGCKVEFQSKAGGCTLSTYDLDGDTVEEGDVGPVGGGNLPPSNILLDLLLPGRHNEGWCRGCSRSFNLKLVAVLAPEDDPEKCKHGVTVAECDICVNTLRGDGSRRRRR
jgi:hypothetical protein